MRSVQSKRGVLGVDERAQGEDAMEPAGEPVFIQQHNFQKLKPAGDKQPDINWKQAVRAALISGLANDVLNQLKKMQNVMKQQQ